MTAVERARTIALTQLAPVLGYQPDPNDKRRWKKPGSVVSINGAKFYDHLKGCGGGGAIDFTMHAKACAFREALMFLQDWTKAPTGAGSPSPTRDQKAPLWSRVAHYLIETRKLDRALIETCYRRGLITTDTKGNAIFVMRTAQAIPIGAEVRGTLPNRSYKRMATGTNKAQGGFGVNRQKQGPLILTESALDALSILSLSEFDYIKGVISTGGATPHLPDWLRTLNPERLICGFDADETGETCAKALLKNHAIIQRLSPYGGKDWNNILVQKRS